MFIQKSLSSRQQQAPRSSCQRSFLGIVVVSRRRSFTVSGTESVPKSRNYSILSLENEKIILRYYRVKVYKMRKEMNFWLAVSTNGQLTRLCHKWNNFCLFWFMFGCAWLWLGESFLQKCRRKSSWFSSSWFVFFRKQCEPSPPNNIVVRFGPSKEC